MPQILLADCGSCVDLTDTDGRIGAERSREVHTIARPSGDQTFRVCNSRLCVLHDVAFDVAPLAVAEARVTLRSEVDGEDTITPEDVGAECGQTCDAAVVRGLCDEVGLVEVNARGRQRDDFGQIDRHETVHLHLAHRGVLQDVDRRIVRVVSQNVAEGERVNVFVFRV